MVLTTDGEGTVTGNANFSMVVLPFLTVEYMFRRYFCKIKSTHGAEEMMVDWDTVTMAGNTFPAYVNHSPVRLLLK